MSHLKVLLAIRVVLFLLAFSSLAHAVAPAANNYTLNTEVQNLLADNLSAGDCFSKVTFSSNKIERRLLVFPTPKSKPVVKWVRVVCEAEVTPHFLLWLEIRLSHEGVLNKQDIFTDGVKVGLDNRLYDAIKKFQGLRGLALGGLSYETINLLSELDMPDGH